MGLFDSFFSASGKFSQNEYYLTEKEIRALVSKIQVKSVEPGEEDLLEREILARRRGDGKISLRQIYETLLRLQNTYKISQQDKDGLMKVFTEHFRK